MEKGISVPATPGGAVMDWSKNGKMMNNGMEKTQEGGFSDYPKIPGQFRVSFRNEPDVPCQAQSHRVAVSRSDENISDFWPNYVQVV